jgi:hypothetical protein
MGLARQFHGVPEKHPIKVGRSGGCESRRADDTG